MGEYFTHKDVFPLIQDVIEQLCERTGEAKHDAIVDELMRHQQGFRVIELAVGRGSKLTKKEMASNLAYPVDADTHQG